MAVIAGQAEGVDVGVDLGVETLGEDGDHKDVDEEADKEGDRRLDEEVHVGLLHLGLLGPVDVPRLHQGAGRCKVRIWILATSPMIQSILPV